MTQSSSQKYLGIHLDEKLNFIYLVSEKVSNADKGVCVIEKLTNNLPKIALLTLYKSFVRPHLDYGDIIYDQPKNESFCNKFETVPCNAESAIIGLVQRTAKVKLYIYKELDLESLKSRRWLKQTFLLFL